MLRRKALPFNYELMAREIGMELAAMEFAEAQVKVLDESIKELYGRVDPAQTLRLIPGMGDIIAAAIEAFSSPIDRFHP